MSSLVDYTAFNFPANSAQSLAVSSFVEGTYNFTDTSSYLTGTTSITLSGMSSGFNRTIYNSTLQTLTINPGGVSVFPGSCYLITYNGSNWIQLLSLTSATGINAQDLQFAAGIANPTISQATAVANTTPQNLYLIPQAPNAGSTGIAAGTPGSFIVELANPVGSGAMPGFQVVNSSDGYILAQIGKVPAGSDFNIGLWMGIASGPTIANSVLYVADGTVQLNAADNSQYVQITGGNVGIAVFSPFNSGLQVGNLQGLSLDQPNIGWFPSITNPNLVHMIRNGDTATTNLSIQAQSAVSGTGTTNKNGGALLLQSGSASDNEVYGIAGAVRIQLAQETNETLIEATEPIIGQRVIALAQIGPGISSSQMPTGTGDGVIHISNANKVPTAAPATGAVLYAATGALWVYQSNGSNFQISPTGVQGVTGPQGATGTVPWAAASGLTNQFIGTNTSTGTIAQILVSETVINPTGLNPVYGFVNYSQSTGTNTNIIAQFTPPTGVLQDWVVTVAGVDTVQKANYYRADLPFTVMLGNSTASGMSMNPTGPLSINVRYGASGIGWVAGATTTATAVNILVTGVTGTVSWTAVGQVSSVI